MPKKIITERTLPIALSELDQWSGKLTWDLFGRRLAEILGEKTISRHTLLSYPELVDAFNERKQSLKEAKESEPRELNVTLESTLKQIDSLESKIKRLERENALLKEQFVRWQYNLYMMPDIDIGRLNAQRDKPLTEVKRR